MTRYMALWLILIASAASAQISEVSGTAAHGETIEISGSGFGTKAQAAPRAWDDFDDGIDSAIDTVGYDPGYYDVGHPNATDLIDDETFNRYPGYNGTTGDKPFDIQQYDCRHPYYSDIRGRFSGDMCIVQDLWDIAEAGCGSNRGICYSCWGDPDPSQKWYISYWFYQDDYHGTALYTDNAKVTPFLVGETWNGHPQCQTQEFWYASSGYIQFGSCSGVGLYPRANDKYVNSLGAWTHYELFADQGDYEVANGWAAEYRNGVLIGECTGNYNVTGCEDDFFGAVQIGNNFHAALGPEGNEARVAQFLSELYVDHGFSRVMIGNASTLAACTHTEVQIPSYWSAGGDSIAITVNTGSFAVDDIAWLFVVDSTNTSSAGYQITIGASAASSAPGNPSVVRAGNSAGLSWSAPDPAGDFYHVYVNRTDTPQGGGAIVPGSDYAVSSSDVDDTYDALLSVPRHKMHMSPTQPDSLWLIYSTGGSYISANGGETWGAGPDFGTYDMHAGIWGVGQDIYFTAISAGGPRFAKATAATVAVDDSLAWGDVGSHSVTTVDEDGRWWIFTRDSNDDWECLEYNYSDNDGTSWTHAALLPRGSCALRFGAFLIDGAASVMVKDESSPYDYWLYRWNGSSFSDLGQVAIGTQRRFSMAYTDDGTVHLIYAKADDLIHATASWSGASLGAWSEEYVVNDDPDAPMSLPEFMWCPIVTQWGENLLIAAINNEAGWAHAWLWNPTSGLGAETDLGIPTGEIQMDGTQFPGIQAPARMPSSATYWPVAWFDNVGDDINVIQVALPDGDSATAQRTGVTAETSMDITVPAAYDISVFVRAYDSEGNALSTSDTTNVDGN